MDMPDAREDEREAIDAFLDFFHTELASQISSSKFNDSEIIIDNGEDVFLHTLDEIKEFPFYIGIADLVEQYNRKLEISFINRKRKLKIRVER